MTNYTHGLPFIRLLRRLIADGFSLYDIPARIADMRASGEIQMVETPRQRARREVLPEKWWLVQEEDGRLRIDTDWQPIDPIELLYRERLPPQPLPAVLSSPTPREPPPARRPRKAPRWIREIDPVVDDAIKLRGPFATIGDARAFVERTLEGLHKAILTDRTIERGIHTHRPHWLAD